MPRLAEQLEPCTLALQEANSQVRSRLLDDHPKHGLLKDQLRRIIAFLPVCPPSLLGIFQAS